MIRPRQLTHHKAMIRPPHEKMVESDMDEVLFRMAGSLSRDIFVSKIINHAINCVDVVYLPLHCLIDPVPEK